MKRMFLTVAFIGMVTIIGNAQTKKEKVPPPPLPPPVAIAQEEVPPLPPPVPLPPSVNTKYTLCPQKDNLPIPPGPPVPESSKAIKKSINEKPRT